MTRYRGITLIYIVLFVSAALFSTTSAITEECGVINKDQFRDNRTVTQINEFPWMARVAFNSTYDDEIFLTTFRCHAVLISERYLIVTARCASGTRYEGLSAVLLGDWNTSKDFTEEDCDDVTGKCTTSILIEVEEIIIHPSYNALRRSNDIALLRLIEAVSYSDYIRPICFPSKDIANKEFGSEELKLTGWLQRVNGQKRKMSVFIYNQLDCQRMLLAKYNMSKTYMCGIADEVGFSFMSGAALMDVNDSANSQPGSAYLVGLLAYGTTSINARARDVFIRIDPYLDWINDNIN